jgi:hypothetical protein
MPFSILLHLYFSTDLICSTSQLEKQRLDGDSHNLGILMHGGRQYKWRFPDPQWFEEIAAISRWDGTGSDMPRKEV